MNTAPPQPAPGDSEPAPSPSVPNLALWSDSDPPNRPAAPAASAADSTAAPNEKSMPTIGHIGRYALKYRLGEGGLGTVYAAHDPLLSRLIAVKTLNVKVDEGERESFNARFINEARAAGGLSHPHIVTVFDAGISDERAYIAMELLKGRDLRQLRQEGWRATPAQAALIVRRVADALAFAHSKGVVHRDVKPANIFMVGRTQPRVLDFGIARIAHAQEHADPLSGAGSPHYMAPEQVRREPADRRADVFSLGVVLYELLTDSKPFRGESLPEIREAVLRHEPMVAHKVDPAVPKELALIAARAMAKDPEHRFRSARSFARELRQWLDSHPAAGDGEIAVRPPVSRRSRVLTACAIVAAAAGAFLVWQVLDRPAGVSAAGAPATAEPSGSSSRMAPTTTSDAPSPTIVAETPTTAGPTSSTPASPADTTPTVAMAGSLAVASNEARAGERTTNATEALAPARAGAGPMAPAASPPTSVTSAKTTRPPAAAIAATGPIAVATATPRETAKERRAREARERDARDSEARVAAANKLVAPPTGTVRIAISPWGLVEVDGAPSGAAPPLTELRLAEGRHQIVVRNGDFAPFTATVDVAAGQAVSLRHKFGS